MTAPARVRLLFLLVFLAYLLVLPQTLLVARPQDGSAGTTVSIFLSARDTNGNPITDLKADEVRVLENGTALRIAAFKNAAEGQLTVGLLLDSSGSRRFQFPGAERDGAAQFLEELARLRANAFIESFDEYVYLHADATSDMAELHSGLQRALAKTQQSSSSLYTAILDTSRRKLAPQAGRKILVLTSDGVDNSSPQVDRELKRVTKKLLQDGTILYAILLASPDDKTRPAAAREGQKNIKMIAEQSGGEAFVADSVEQVTAAFQRIAAFIAAEYRVEFVPRKLPWSGELRRLRVETTRKNVVVSAPGGFFAPEE
ncbi:MAG TPA: VWA domain-containing protein [Candidatus Acidoferrales bacterium]|nr:VWA domain-containing protein [Candidatus Acidoferrales bacterium]